MEHATMCHPTYKTCSHKAHEELHCLKQTMRWKKLLSMIKQSVILPLAGNILCMVFKIQKKSCGIAARGATRTFGGDLGRSTVAHFARKVRGANIAAAKHELKIQRRYAPERWLYSLRVRGPHLASKVSYNAGATTDDYAGQRKSPLRGRWCLFTNLDFYGILNTLTNNICKPNFQKSHRR